MALFLFEEAKNWMKGQMNVVDDFERWFFEDAKSEKTIQSYTNDVSPFQQYLLGEQEEVFLSRYTFGRYKQKLIDENY